MSRVRNRPSNRPIRVALVQRTISRYRVPLFNRLSDYKDLDITCFYSRGNQYGAPQVDCKFRLRSKKVPIIYNPRSGQALYQGVVSAIVSGRYDVVICTQQINNLAPLVLWVLRRLCQYKFIWWGMGFDPYRQKSPKSHPESARNELIVTLKNFLWKKADARMVYSEEGQEYSVKMGIDPKEIFVLHNTLDVEKLRETSQKISDTDLEAVRTQLAIRKNTFVYLFVGRLHKYKEVPFLVEAFGKVIAEKEDVKLVIVGDGEEREAVNLSINRGNFGGRVTNMGALYDEYKLAQLFLLSHLVVMPGQVGLAICHAFAYGRPILTRWSQSYTPELEYLKSGVNGLRLEDDSVEAYARAMMEAQRDREKTVQWSKAAWRTGSEMTMSRMAERFRDAIVSVVDRG